MKNENISSRGLTEELRKIIIRTFKKRKVQSLFIDNIWGIDLAGIQLISKFNKVIRFFLSVIDIFKKYKWFMLLEDKKCITITIAFQKILDESNCKPNKIW